MTLQEAIRSGRRFRRSDSKRKYFDWYIEGEDSHSICGNFSYKDILANDWEIEPEPEIEYVVTKNQLAKIISLLQPVPYVRSSEEIANIFVQQMTPKK